MLETENSNLIESKTKIKLTDNMKKIVSKWNKNRLARSIDIFNSDSGESFEYMKRIYASDSNFVNRIEEPKNGHSKVVQYAKSNKFNNFDDTIEQYGDLDDFDNRHKDNKKTTIRRSGSI